MPKKELNFSRLIQLSMAISFVGYVIFFSNQEDSASLGNNILFLLIFVPITGLILAFGGAALYEVGKFIKGWLYNEN
jgi:hypothetical protein